MKCVSMYFESRLLYIVYIAFRKRNDMRIFTFLMLCLFMFSSANAGENEVKLPVEFTKKPNLPKPQQGSYQKGQVTSPVIYGRQSYDRQKASVAYVLWALENGNEPANEAFWRYHLAQKVNSLNDEASAFSLFGDLLNMPNNAPSPSGVQPPMQTPALKRQAAICRALMLARYAVGLKNETAKKSVQAAAIAELQKVKENYPPQTAYDFLRIAEVYAYLGDKEGFLSLLPRIKNRDGHPDNSNWGRLQIALQATILLRALGLDEEIDNLLTNDVDRGLNAENQNMWRAAWRVADRILKDSKGTPVPVIADVKDGVYTGTGPGYDGPISVTVMVQNGRITNVEADGKESRPFSAMKTIPERIERSQSFAVDAVTSATITSNAIVIGAIEAVSEGKK